MSRIRGAIAAAATPLRANGSEIDCAKLTAHCARLLRLGCDGINLLGTTGEATSFSVEQRLAAMTAVAQSDLPLSRFMVGTGAAALGDVVRLTAHAHDLGFAGALILPPFYFKGIDAPGLHRFFDALMVAVGRGGLRLYLYNFPQNTGIPYEPDFVTELVRRYPDTVIGLKDSSGDLDYAARLAQTLPGFDVFPSAEGALAKVSEFGFAGCISATLNVTAPLVGQALSEAQPAASETLARAVRIRSSLARFPLVSAVKFTLAELLSDPTWERPMPPLRPLSPQEMTELRTALDHDGFGELRAAFKNSRPLAA